MCARLLALPQTHTHRVCTAHAARTRIQGAAAEMASGYVLPTGVLW